MNLAKLQARFFEEYEKTKNYKQTLNNMMDQIQTMIKENNTLKLMS